MSSTKIGSGSQTENNGNQYSISRKYLRQAFETSQNNKVGPFKFAFNPGNPTIVRDSSDFTRFKKLVAINNNYNNNGFRSSN
tara:strand:+ start:118 stop:363 length:246 start_codon:yes stop_codon:yes gene_type:complete